MDNSFSRGVHQHASARGRLHPILRVALYLPAVGIAASILTIPVLLAWQVLRSTLVVSLLEAPLRGAGTEAAILSQGPILVAVVLTTLFFRSKLDRRSFVSLGFGRGGGWLAETVAGFGLGALLMILVLGAELGLGGYRLAGVAWQERSVWAILTLLSVTFAGFLVVAFNEELLARGYVLQNLSAAWGIPFGVLASSVLFSLGHLFNPGAGITSTVGIFFAGLLLAGAYLATGRLWLPIGLHLSWNFVQGPVLGFPVSGIATDGLLQLQATGPDLLTGGEFGPEASLVGVLANLLGLGLLWRWRRGKWQVGSAMGGVGEGKMEDQAV